MKSFKWASHLDKKDRPAFEKRVSESRDVLRRLYQLVKEDYNVSDKAMHDRDNFMMPAWSEKQAYELGFQKFAIKMMKLLEE